MQKEEGNYVINLHERRRKKKERKEWEAGGKEGMWWKP